MKDIDTVNSARVTRTIPNAVNKDVVIKLEKFALTNWPVFVYEYLVHFRRIFELVANELEVKVVRVLELQPPSGLASVRYDDTTQLLEH